MYTRHSPQIGDRITARHMRHTIYCENLHRSEVNGYVHDIGNFVLYVVDAENIVIIHTQSGWDITVHPEVIKEELI